jgi:hypothetical protein
LSALSEINPVPWTVVNTQFRNTFSYRPHIAKVAQRQATDSSIDASPRLPIREAFEPYGFLRLSDEFTPLRPRSLLLAVFRPTSRPRTLRLTSPSGFPEPLPSSISPLPSGLFLTLRFLSSFPQSLISLFSPLISPSAFSSAVLIGDDGGGGHTLPRRRRRRTGRW